MGTRPVTAVLTRAERDKFNREALRFLFTPARRQQLGTQIPQAVDFDQFCVRWNEDVTVSEHHIRYGRLERDPDPENIINRKTPASLKSYWTDSRKRTNAKATMENVRDQLSDLRRSRTVAVTAPDAPAASASGDSRGAIGVMGNGLRISFPPLPTQDCPRPRPQPPQCFASCHGTLGARECTSAIDCVAMASEAGCEGEPAVEGGELFAGSSGSGFDVRCTNYLDGTGASSTAAGGGYQAPSAPLWGGGTNPLACAPIALAAAAHATGANAMRDGTIIPQPGLTQMASAADSGGGYWPFLWPRLTGMAKTPGDPVFVVPPAACSTTKTILPRFALGVPPAHNLQPWNPRPAQGAHEAKQKRAKKQCQECGHVWSVGLWKGLHVGGSRKQALECRVPGGPNGQRRVPDFPNRKRVQFDKCDCAVCKEYL